MRPNQYRIEETRQPGTAIRVTRDHMDLAAVSLDLSEQLQRYHSIARDAQYTEYHRSRKYRLPDLLVELAAKRAHTDPKKLQAEIVSIGLDFVDQMHLHRDAYAFCRVLGERHGAYDPIDAEFCVGRMARWEPATVGRIIDIPPGTPHDFRASQLYFLSVQTPPIVGAGRDDYELVKRAAR
jgi:hypothetical protein